MEWVPFSPLNLYKLREVLEHSSTFVKANNIVDLQGFSENLFMEEIPGDVKIYTFEENGKVIGFIKISDFFPLPGFTHIRLLVLKEEYCGKGYGSKIIDKLKGKNTLWIDPPNDQFSLPFWESKGFKPEAGRWSL